jgi:hypothetical protein
MPPHGISSVPQNPATSLRSSSFKMAWLNLSCILHFLDVFKRRTFCMMAQRVNFVRLKSLSRQV